MVWRQGVSNKAETGKDSSAQGKLEFLSTTDSLVSSSYLAHSTSGKERGCRFCQIKHYSLLVCVTKYNPFPFCEQPLIFLPSHVHTHTHTTTHSPHSNKKSLFFWGQMRNNVRGQSKPISKCFPETRKSRKYQLCSLPLFCFLAERGLT